MTSSLGANTRTKPTENLKLVLFSEVNGLCPKCNKPLMNNKNKQLIKLYEVAHIYPHSPLPQEIELLKNEEKLSENLDHEDNLIALCRDCHKIFDTPRSIEGYREMVKIKKELQRICRLKESWFDSKLESEINEVINSLVNLKANASAELSFKAMKVDEKASEELTFMIRVKIKSYIQYFYKHIQNRFSELDKIKPYTSDTIFSQVKTYYLQLKKSGADQNQIFKALSDWIYSVAKVKNYEVAEIFVSFFVQNCEVYS